MFKNATYHSRQACYRAISWVCEIVVPVIEAIAKDIKLYVLFGLLQFSVILLTPPCVGRMAGDMAVFSGANLTPHIVTFAYGSRCYL